MFESLVYGEGEDETLVFSLIVVFVVVSDLAAGDSFTIVVSFSTLVSPGGVATVVSFCSHAARSATPANAQMSFFIMS
jgi:hypothetical protein